MLVIVLIDTIGARCNIADVCNKDKYNINETSNPLDGGSSGPSSTSGGRVSSSEPTYMMEHLATFTVTKETGIVYPADGMRRLLQLEKSNGIWSQKMQLRLERNWVLIMDNETGVKIYPWRGYHFLLANGQDTARSQSLPNDDLRKFRTSKRSSQKFGKERFEIDVLDTYIFDWKLDYIVYKIFNNVESSSYV